MSVRAVFEAADGQETTIEADEGRSMMHAALALGISGIEADCGGSMVCGTCHVYVDETWIDRLPSPSEMEQAIIEGLPRAHPRARLSCQIQLHPAIDGIRVGLPPSQY